MKKNSERGNKDGIVDVRDGKEIAEMDENENRSDAGAARRAIRRKVWGIMIIVGVMIRSFTRYARNTQEVRNVPEVPPITMIENTIVDSTLENAGNDTVEDAIADSTNDTAEDTIADSTNHTAAETIADAVTEIDGNTIRTHMTVYFNMMQVGDIKETMIDAMGEPEEIRESQENPDYEEAVYSLSKYGDKLVIVLENGVITDIYAESTIDWDM